MATREGTNLIQQIGVRGIQGQRQVVTAILLGSLTTGNIAVTITKVGMTGSPAVINAAVVTGDTLVQGATKVAAALNANANFAAVLKAASFNNYIYIQTLAPAANDGTMQLAYTGAGTTPGSGSITTAGVAATPTIKTLSGLMIEISSEVETKQYRAHGWKTNTSSVLHKHWSTGSYNGPASYVEIALILAGLLPYTITPSGASTFTWNFLPNAQGQDNMTTYDYWCGDDYQVERFPEMIFSSLDISWGLEEVSISGNLFSRKRDLVDPTLWSSSTQFAERPISSGDVDVFCNTTFGAIGTTKLANSFDAKLSISDKQKQKWTLNSANDFGYADVYEQPVDVVLTLAVEADNDGIILRDDLLAQNGKYIRISSTSDLLVEAGVPYKLEADLFVKLRAMKDLKSYDGSIYAFEFTLGAQYDATMGRAYKFKLVTGLATL